MISVLMTASAWFLGADPAIYTLDPGVEVWDVATYDMNGDGKKEIFAFCCDEKSYPLKKLIAVFFADAQGAYPKTPSTIIPLDPSIGAAFFAEVDGAPPLELVTVDAEKATVYGCDGKTFTQKSVSEFPSLFPSGVKHPVFLKDVAVDLDGDGINEWLIPVASGCEIRNAKGLIRHLNCDVVSDIRSDDSVTIIHRLPAFLPITLPNQKVKGLAFLSDEIADFWYGPTWNEHKRFKIPVNLEEKWDATAKMVDINGDGIPDLVVTQTKGTVNMQSRTQVYIATAPFEYPETPTATFEAKGAITSPFLLDVNGDKKADLIFITVPIGVKFFVNYFMLGKFSVSVEVYLYKDGGYATKPDFKTSLSFDAPEGRQRTAYALGDFNGDGRIDAAFGSGSDKIEIRTGSDTQFLSSKPWVTVSLPPFGVARAYNLVEGKKAQDLILFHPGGDHKSLLHVVVF